MNSMTNLDLDSDIDVSLHEEELPKVLKRIWPGEKIILPVSTENGIILKSIDEVSHTEFLSWIKTVMPLSSEMIKAFSKNSKKEEIFNTLVAINRNGWLFGRIIKTDTWKS